MISSISVNDLYKINKNIIDIRSIESYNNNHIPNAINIPFEKLIANPIEYLSRNQIYYIYCKRGITSIKTCEILIKQGFNVININGGYEEWLLNQK